MLIYITEFTTLESVIHEIKELYRYDYKFIHESGH